MALKNVGRSFIGNEAGTAFCIMARNDASNAQWPYSPFVFLSFLML
jgi:hypothetical protein